MSADGTAVRRSVGSGVGRQRAYFGVERLAPALHSRWI